jgi:hypothetical protein
VGCALTDRVLSKFAEARTIRFKYMQSLSIERALQEDDVTPFDVTLVLKEKPRPDAKGCRIVFRGSTGIELGELDNLLGWVLSVEATTTPDGATRYLVFEAEYRLLKLVCENIEVALT